MKITILFSKFFQNIRQNASIVTCFQKFIHSKRVSKIFIFYIKNDNFLKILKIYKIGSKYTQKRTKLYHFKKFSRGHVTDPPPPPKQSASLRHAQISKYKKIYCPPPSKSWLRPCLPPPPLPCPAVAMGFTYKD